MTERCARYHFNSLSFNCEAYQKLQEHIFPACHPCKGCEKRSGKENKKETSLRMRQGGRHKKSPEQIKAEKAAFSLTYYHNHKVLKGIKPRKERTNPTEILCKGKCGKTKPAGEFYRDSRCSNGHRPKCKVCEGEIRVENLRKQRGNKTREA